MPVEGEKSKAEAGGGRRGGVKKEERKRKRCRWRESSRNTKR